MIIIKALVITIYVMEVTSPELNLDSIFNKTAEDMFNEKLGNIVNNKKKLDNSRRMNIQNFISAKLSYNQNRSVFRTPETTTTEKGLAIVTPSSKNEGTPRPAMTIEEIRLRIKKKEVNQLLRGSRTQIPSFVNDDDDPNILTQHFDMNISIPHSRRVWYHINAKQEGEIQRIQKVRITFLMIQFIYMTRRQMGYMSALRNKYKSTYKYQIGYLFGLLRMVRQQQNVLYKTLVLYHESMENAQIPLQFFYRIVMLNVDINDIMRYIIKLNFKQNLAYNPKYYMDSSEYFASKYSSIINKP